MTNEEALGIEYALYELQKEVGGVEVSILIEKKGTIGTGSIYKVQIDGQVHGGTAAHLRPAWEEARDSFKKSKKKD